ncbi:hypothetical protein TWF481_006338 [Arthrobotrys musiformis]|uniref:Nucleoside phosphorylase domain-containing protein n=1 Tax=Arthrobotrys musiformis TaxID=47236 RepID=A0AAV9WID5_9PEZI
MAQKYTYEDYTIAVIIPVEYQMTAFRHMLDQEHPALPTKKGDTNMYIHGEYNGHNIVIACLPGKYGKASASAVSTNLNRSFPSIIWRFLITTGGAVPSLENDIRLGDVVVSMPDQGTHGGVVEYDLGRDIEDDFELKGFLFPPPTLLRNVAQVMKSDHFIRDNKIEEFISLMTKNAEQPSIFERPSETLHPDILYAADYPHISGEKTCANCDKSRAVIRGDRYVEGSMIHYGLVASGDRAIRSATKRDALAEKIGNVLCFEREAAGVATESPCIVICGISNYSDSHENDVWNYYAAAAAAAVGKEMISYLTPKSRPSDTTSSALSSHRGMSSNSTIGTFTILRNEFGSLGIQQAAPGTIPLEWVQLLALAVDRDRDHDGGWSIL